jgi:redox-sensing transcriptional repressor
MEEYMPQTSKQFSIPIIRRLPEYHAFLEQALKEGEKTVSSTAIARHLNQDPIVVRKDLEGIGAVGRPKIGFKTVELINAIEDYMGWGELNDLVIVGCGDLGSAIMGYPGFSRRGYKIVAGFDIDPQKIDTEIHGITIFPADKITNLVPRLHIEIAIMTVPAPSAQNIADLLIEAGIKGIWNFSPAALNVPKDITVQQEDLIASLAILQKNVQHIRGITQPGGTS